MLISGVGCYKEYFVIKIQSDLTFLPHFWMAFPIMGVRGECIGDLSY